MNAIKKLLGIVWIAIGVAAGYFLLIDQAIPKFETGKQEDLIPAIIYTFVLAPIIVGGLSIFGYYSLTGEYSDK
jgi:nitric oxide reductase large subunit